MLIFSRLLIIFLNDSFTPEIVLAPVQTTFPEEKINGVFGPLTQQVTTQYQKAAGIIRSAEDENAGNVGPKTLRQLRIEEEQRMYQLVRGYGWKVL